MSWWEPCTCYRQVGPVATLCTWSPCHHRGLLGKSAAESALEPARAMPELPEVEITARRIASAVVGEQVESALAPGMVTMKTFDPPLDSLAGHTITAVRRRGK